MANKITLSASLTLANAGTNIAQSAQRNYSGNQLNANGSYSGGSYVTTGSAVELPKGDLGTVDSSAPAWCWIRNDGANAVNVYDDTGSKLLSQLLTNETYGPIKHPFVPQVKHPTSSTSISYLLVAA